MKYPSKYASILIMLCLFWANTYSSEPSGESFVSKFLTTVSQSLSQLKPVQKVADQFLEYKTAIILILLSLFTAIIAGMLATLSTLLAANKATYISRIAFLLYVIALSLCLTGVYRATIDPDMNIFNKKSNLEQTHS